MIRIVYVLLFSILFMIITACTTISVNTKDQSSYPPLKENAEISVFTDENQIIEKYKVVASLYYDNPALNQIVTLDSAIGPLKEKAGELGCNAIIIDKYDAIKQGIIFTGIYIEARAIRLGILNQR
ncbi:MAG: hypothetical protein AB2L12_14505 [Smithellaceae bacterium]